MLVVGLPETKVKHDACFILTIEHHSKFKHKVPARGYNLKSWLDFERSLTMTKKVTVKEVTFEEYKKLNPWAS
jgi:hypothetical protein